MGRWHLPMEGQPGWQHPMQVAAGGWFSHRHPQALFSEVTPPGHVPAHPSAPALPFAATTMSGGPSPFTSSTCTAPGRKSSWRGRCGIRSSTSTCCSPTAKTGSTPSKCHAYGWLCHRHPNPDALTLFCPRRSVQLNGQPLAMVDDGTLPELKPRPLRAGRTLVIPPLTMSFYVVKNVNALACRYR